MEVRHLSVADALALHAETMERMGDPPSPPRDPGLLESVILRPQMAAHYEGADLVRQAALLAVGVVQNRPFRDGNERTAYMATLVFLRINGRPLTGEPLEFARRLAAVAVRTDSLETATARFVDWLRANVS